MISSNSSNIDDNIEIIDTTWINDFEKEENDYLSYYNENITYLKITYIYIDVSSEIKKIKEIKINLSKENYLFKNELIKLIKDNVFLDGSKYSLLLLLKYNITLKPTELKNFLKSNINGNNNNNYLTSITNIEDIIFEKTITMFHDLNSLFVVFYQKPHINSGNHSGSNSGINYTRRIFVNNLKQNKKHKKTIKKTT